MVEVDFARGVIELPGSRTKNALPHVIPLPPPAVAILAGMSRGSTARVFTGFRSWSWAKARLDALVSLPAWTVHDVRRSVSTGLHEHLNGDGHLIELILNHSSGSRGAIAGVYDRSQRRPSAAGAGAVVQDQLDQVAVAVQVLVQAGAGAAPDVVDDPGRQRHQGIKPSLGPGP